MGSHKSVASNSQSKSKAARLDNGNLLDALCTGTLGGFVMARGKSGGHARSAISGRYVTSGTAARHPRTTVVERGGNHSSGTHHRSATTGRYVTPATAARHPRTTVTEKG